MADIADVERAFVSLIADAVYPCGVDEPSTIVQSDGTNPKCRVFAGWPTPNQLEADLAAGVVNISIFAQPGMERNVTRYPREWVDQSFSEPCIVATLSGRVVTLAGQPKTGAYVTVHVSEKAYSYAAAHGDLLETICAGLLDLIQVDYPGAYRIGASISIPTGGDLIVRCAAPGSVIRELKRQQRRFLITIWAPSNDARVATSRIIDPLLASTDFLNFSDNSLGRLTYEYANDVDRSGKQGLSCRDNFWWVEYATTQVMPGYPITTFGQRITVQDGTAQGASFNYLT